MVDASTELKIVKEFCGVGTGDRIYQTEDGSCWKTWDGITRTGESLGQKTNGHIKPVN